MRRGLQVLFQTQQVMQGQIAKLSSSSAPNPGVNQGPEVQELQRQMAHLQLQLQQKDEKK